MKKIKSWRILLISLITGFGVLLAALVFIDFSENSNDLIVEFVSAPQIGFWGFHSGDLSGSQIAIGDLTGDNYPEIVLSVVDVIQIDSAEYPEDFFYNHPLVFSWNGETFESLKAEWVGITSYISQVLVSDAQAIPSVLLISDIDADGVNELLVGTASYGSENDKGALYIFQWDGERFVAEYSEYCMGGIAALDYVSAENLVVVSSSHRPTEEQSYDRYICPDVAVGEDEPVAGLYALRGTEINGYITQTLALDNNSSLITIPSEYLTATQFIRGHFDLSRMQVDWKMTQVWHYAGEMISDTLNLPIEDYSFHVDAADLDGDTVMELVVLAIQEFPSDDIFADVYEYDLTWLVFKGRGVDYHLVHKHDMQFLSEPGQLFDASFAVGDVDNDGTDEILGNNGALYKWRNEHLALQMNVMTELGGEFCGDIESAYIGKVHADGQNRIILTARVPQEDGLCSDTVFPQMYVVKVE